MTEDTFRANGAGTPTEFIGTVFKENTMNSYHYGILGNLIENIGEIINNAFILKYDENQIEQWVKRYEDFKSPSKRGFDVSEDENHIIFITKKTTILEILHLDGDGNPIILLEKSTYGGTEFLNLVTISQDSTTVYFTATKSGGKDYLWRWEFTTTNYNLPWYFQIDSDSFYSVLEIGNHNLLISTLTTSPVRGNFRKIEFQSGTWSDIWIKELYVNTYIFDSSASYTINMIYYNPHNDRSYHLLNNNEPLFIWLEANTGDMIGSLHRIVQSASGFYKYKATMIGYKLYMTVYMDGAILIEFDTVAETFDFYSIFNDLDIVARGLYSINFRLYFSGWFDSYNTAFIFSTGPDLIEISPTLLSKSIQSEVIMTSNMDSEIFWEPTNNGSNTVEYFTTTPGDIFTIEITALFARDHL